MVAVYFNSTGIERNKTSLRLVEIAKLSNPALWLIIPTRGGRPGVLVATWGPGLKQASLSPVQPHRHMHSDTFFQGTNSSLLRIKGTTCCTPMANQSNECGLIPWPINLQVAELMTLLNIWIWSRFGCFINKCGEKNLQAYPEITCKNELWMTSLVWVKNHCYKGKKLGYEKTK